MVDEPSVEHWEQILAADLLPYLIPAEQPRAVRSPSDGNQLPAGARADLASCIGRHGLEDLLIVPASARTCERLRRRGLYRPQCVLGAGERAAALWVQALPVPGVRAQVPISEVAAIAWQAAGITEQLLITGRTGRLPVRYDAADGIAMDTWTRRLRRYAAGEPAPVPVGYPVARISATRITAGDGGRPFDLTALRLDPDDDIAASGRLRRAGRRTCLVAVTPRELVILRSIRSARPPGRITDALYLPRRAITEVGISSGALRLRSAGLDLRVALGSRRTAAAVLAWLGQVLNDHDRSGTVS